MAKTSNEELEGTTLEVYLLVVRKGKPVGPRDVMKSANLSSPSVAYRHLQKLEDMGYLQKNEYGEYNAKNKAHVTGYIWFGRLLMPKMWVYSIVFLAIFLFELWVLIVHFRYETFEFKIFFALLLLITGVALGLFFLEGFLQNKRRHRSGTNKNES